MKYAFDMQGTLVSGDLEHPKPLMIALVRALVAAGHEVYIISACNQENRTVSPLNVLRNLCVRFSIPNHGIFLAYHEYGAEEGRTERAAQAKIDVMQIHDIRILFDDLPSIVEAVKRAGLEAVQV